MGTLRPHSFLCPEVPLLRLQFGPVAQRARRDYLNALHREILNTPWRGSQGRTVFFGGGTPSELSVPETAAVVDCLHQAFGFEPHSEWTIECNPGTVDLESLADYRRMGFNRISLGVQSFDDHLLQTLGRLHNAAEAREAYQLARRAGFDNINIDLIFSLPRPDPRCLERGSYTGPFT